MRISDWSSDVCSSDLAQVCLEYAHVAPGQVLGLHQVEQTKKRPWPRILFDTHPSPDHFVQHQGGSTILSIAWPGEGHRHDRPVAILQRLVAKTEFGTAHRRIPRVRDR